MATASTSPRGSKRWPNRAASASRTPVLTQTRGKFDFPVEDLADQALKKHRPSPCIVFRVRRESPHPNPPPLAGGGGSAAGIPFLTLPRKRGREGWGLPARKRPALPDKPSIAVLPFQNMSGDPEQEYFADGMVRGDHHRLSRIRWLFVIARNSTFTYKGHAVDVKQVGRELGVAMCSKARCARRGTQVRIPGS